MAELKLPDLGENIEEAEVLKVLVSKGDTLEKDQNVLELETDKATFELPSTVAGTVRRVHVSEGDKVRLGQTILTVDEGAAEEGEDGEARPPEKRAGRDGEEPSSGRRRRGATAEAEAQEPEKEAAEEKREPESRAEEGRGKARREKKDEGAEPEAGEAAKEGRRPKAAAPDAEEGPGEGREPTDEAAARPEGAGAREGRGPDDAHEQEGAREAEAGKGPAEAREPGRDRAPRKEKEEEEGRPEVAAGPATRRLARELGIRLEGVEPSGPGGRVTAEDVKAAVRERSAGADESGPSPALPDLERWGPVERRGLSGLERAAARHLSTSWRSVPLVTHHDLADVTELERMRRRFEETRRPSDPKITPTALVIKAVVAALRAFPRVNASLDVEREELVLKRYVHVGVAVDTERGLLVPVVRDADRKTTRQIAAEVAGLAERARERKLTREEMEGASFTVTNLGGIGGTGFTPLVSHPEVAILGVSRTREEPSVRDGEIVARLVMPLSLSYDHRVVNGADAARFVRHVASLLEDPLRLLVES